jgi:hypothetical protein
MNFHKTAHHIALLVLGFVAANASAEPSAAEQVALRVHGNVELRLFSLFATRTTDAFKTLSCALGKEEASKLVLANINGPLQTETPLWVAALAKEYEKRFTLDELELLTVRKRIRPYLFDKLNVERDKITIELRSELALRAGNVAATTISAVLSSLDPETLKVERSACKQ